MHSCGIIYGDLKAENILFDEEGIINLCDFNLSGTIKLLEKQIQGTTSYLAPEIIKEKPKTPKSDYWSLGILIHLMFYKRHAFTGVNQPDTLNSIVNNDLPAEPKGRNASQPLRQLICDLLVKDVNKRVGNSIKEFMDHPFFKDFNWEEDLSFPKKFFPKNQKQDISKEMELEITRNENYYKIHNLTYDASRDPTKSN